LRRSCRTARLEGFPSAATTDPAQRPAAAGPAGAPMAPPAPRPRVAQPPAGCPPPGDRSPPPAPAAPLSPAAAPLLSRTTNNTGNHQGARQPARRWDRSQRRSDRRRASGWRGPGASRGGCEVVLIEAVPRKLLEQPAGIAFRCDIR
jgi:hypothetical protein